MRSGPPSRHATETNSLFVLLKSGCLVVAETELSAWLQTEHRKGRWPSQRSRKKAVVGAPGKQTEALRNAVLFRVRKGVWSGDKSIVGLRQLLIDSARDDVPSADTLARLVDELHDETGEPSLAESSGSAASVPSNGGPGLPQNSFSNSGRTSQFIEL